MGSILGPYRVIAKTLKVVPIGICQMCDINSISRGIALAPNWCNSLPCTVKTSRQMSSNQRVGCQLCSVVRIYEVYGSKDMRKASGYSLIIGKLDFHFVNKKSKFNTNRTQNSNSLLLILFNICLD